MRKYSIWACHTYLSSIFPCHTCAATNSGLKTWKDQQDLLECQLIVIDSSADERWCDKYSASFLTSPLDFDWLRASQVFAPPERPCVYSILVFWNSDILDYGILVFCLWYCVYVMLAISRHYQQTSDLCLNYQDWVGARVLLVVILAFPLYLLYIYYMLYTIYIYCPTLHWNEVWGKEVELEFGLSVAAQFVFITKCTWPNNQMYLFK